MLLGDRLPVGIHVIRGGGDRPSADHQVDPFGFARIVVVEQQLWFFGEDRLAILVVAILHRTRAADYLLGRDAVTHDGRRAISGSDVRTLRLWDLEGGEKLAAFTGDGDMLSCAFTPEDGQLLPGTK
jgi:hypothetical protein